MREKGQSKAVKTLETPVFSRGIEILTEKFLICAKDFFMLACLYSRILNEVQSCLSTRKKRGAAYDCPHIKIPLHFMSGRARIAVMAMPICKGIERL